MKNKYTISEAMEFIDNTSDEMASYLLIALLDVLDEDESVFSKHNDAHSLFYQSPTESDSHPPTRFTKMLGKSLVLRLAVNGFFDSVEEGENSE